nr:MAG TPA: hypothetical protein [Caudoviricetes sp.]
MLQFHRIASIFAVPPYSGNNYSVKTIVFMRVFRHKKLFPLIFKRVCVFLKPPLPL